MLLPSPFRLPLISFMLIAAGMNFGLQNLFADQVGLTVQATAGADTGGQSNSQNFSLILAPSEIVVPPQMASISYNQSGLSTSSSGSSSGTVQFGSVTASVSARGMEADSLEPPGLNLNDTNASGFFSGTWQDSLFVTSTTLAEGAPVNLLLTVMLNANLSCSGPDASVSAGALFDAGSSEILISNNTCNTGLSETQTLLLATTVGADIPILGQLNIVATAGGRNFETSTSAVDPPSSEFFVDSETPGATYTTASGFTYFTPASPVPEPPDLILVGTGMVAVIGFSLRKAIA